MEEQYQRGPELYMSRSSMGYPSIIRLPCGDYINLHLSTRLKVGSGRAKIYWLSGKSTTYKGLEARALISAWECSSALSFVDRHSESPDSD